MARGNADHARGGAEVSGGRSARPHAVTGTDYRQTAPAPGSSRPQGARARLLRRRTLPGPVAFWVTVALIALFLYASTAPTPLYGVYQAKWGFSAATLTAVFAIYILFLLVTLLVFGSLSDHVGRRPLTMAAIAVDVAASGLFLVADATNAFKVFDPPPVELFDFGDRTSSEVVASLAPGARVVKAFNHVPFMRLVSSPPNGEQHVLFLSGDDAAAKASLRPVLDANNFAVIDLGDLATGSRLQQVGGPLGGLDLRLYAIANRVDRPPVRFAHPVVGPLTLTRDNLAIDGPDALRLLVYHARAGAPARAGAERGSAGGGAGGGWCAA
jgi:hypothetical protein